MTTINSGDRVTHRYARESGTVTATTQTERGLYAAVTWDDPDALELPADCNVRFLDRA